MDEKSTRRSFLRRASAGIAAMVGAVPVLRAADKLPAANAIDPGFVDVTAFGCWTSCATTCSPFKCGVGVTHCALNHPASCRCCCRPIGWGGRT